jgi:hypothetical protein
MPSQVLTALRTATKGLLYTSESDEPFEVFEWKTEEGQLQEERLLELAGETKDIPVKSVPLDEFFADLTKEQDWHGVEEKTAVERYRTLLSVMQNQVSDAKVFRVGEVEVSIYVVGRTEDGGWVGVKTTAVET